MKKKIKEQFRLPNGEYTTNIKKQCKEWHKIIDPICDYFELNAIAFNPGILLRDKNFSIDLPTSLAIKIAELIEAKEKLEAELTETRVELELS